MILFYLFAFILNSSSTTLLAKTASPQFSHGNVSPTCSPETPEKSSSLDGGGKDTCFAQKILPDSKATYYQALKQIFPDLQADGKATSLIARRPELKGLLTEASAAMTGQSFDLADFDSTGTISYLLVEEEAGAQLILLIERISDGDGLLALFQLKPSLKLLDLIDTGNGPEHISLSSSPKEAPFLVKPGAVFFPISSWHDNSGESFDSYSLFVTVNGKLRLAYDGPHFYGYRDPNNYECKNMEGLEELRPLQTSHEGFLDISLKINSQKTCTIQGKNGHTKERLIRKKIYPATLYWDVKANKYMGGSKDFLREGNHQMVN